MLTVLLYMNLCENDPVSVMFVGQKSSQLLHKWIPDVLHMRVLGQRAHFHNDRGTITVTLTSKYTK